MWGQLIIVVRDSENTDEFVKKIFADRGWLIEQECAHPLIVLQASLPMCLSFFISDLLKEHIALFVLIQMKLSKSCLYLFYGQESPKLSFFKKLMQGFVEKDIGNDYGKSFLPPTKDQIKGARHRQKSANYFLIVLMMQKNACILMKTVLDSL